RSVLRSDEETDRRRAHEQRPAEVAHPALGVAAVPPRRVDPDLLDLDRRGRPRRRLRLEEDDAVLLPEPGAALLDLRPRAPAKAVRVALQGVDPDLLAVRGGAGGDEQLVVVERGVAEAR